jgi:nucleotide-binding universal stress UspA family protein
MSGRGVEASLNGMRVAVGGTSLLRERGLDQPDELRGRTEAWPGRGASVLYLVRDARVTGALAWPSSQSRVRGRRLARARLHRKPSPGKRVAAPRSPRTLPDLDRAGLGRERRRPADRVRGRRQRRLARGNRHSRNALGPPRRGAPAVHAVPDDAQAVDGDELLARVVFERDLGASVRRDVIRGEPAEAIVDASRSHGAGMIVIGSRGRGALASAALGSVSSTVAARARCAIVVVRAMNARETPTR